jgi:hypothetical protein
MVKINHFLDKKRRKKFNIVLVLFLVFFAIVGTLITDYRRKKMIEAHPPLEREQFISGIVDEKFTNRGMTYIKLENGEKFSNYLSYNYNYEPSYFGKFIEFGDSIRKQKGTDTLYIYRDNRRYFFLIDEDVK